MKRHNRIVLGLPGAGENKKKRIVWFQGRLNRMDLKATVHKKEEIWRFWQCPPGVVWFEWVSTGNKNTVNKVASVFLLIHTNFLYHTV